VSLGMVIRQIALGIPGVTAAHVVRLRPTGPVFFGEIELTVPREMTVERFDAIRLEFSRRVKERAPEIESLSVVARPEAEKAAA
jgi:divalent metal cation (Fe/Co/Zn/Cd) transporter